MHGHNLFTEKKVTKETRITCPSKKTKPKGK